jgi:hypothetical protein
MAYATPASHLERSPIEKRAHHSIKRHARPTDPHDAFRCRSQWYGLWLNGQAHCFFLVRSCGSSLVSHTMYHRAVTRL